MRCYFDNPDQNFGDLLTAYFMRRLFGVELKISKPRRAELFGVGSLAAAVPGGFTGYILGSGIMHESERHDWASAKVVGLRGYLTAERVKYSGNPVLGDPGLIVDRFAPAVEKQYELGIIPHYVDKGDERIAAWEHKPDVCVIDIQSGVDAVIAKAAACRQIVSSSLHGLILADSLGIPNKWIRLSDKIGGGTFKFLDYYSVYGLCPEPSAEIGYVDVWKRPGIEQLKERLYKMIIDFGHSQGWTLI